MPPETVSAPERLLGLPEVNVALFAFLLNFVWEMWQAPFFRRMPTAPHWEAVQFCTLATFGDAVMMVVGFWVVAAVARSRSWVLDPTVAQVLGLVAVGVGMTLVFEWLATEVLHRWEYAPRMPRLPLLGTGIAPVLQWVLLPPLVVWLVRRQLT